jgi:hypothetical protein
MYLEEVPHVDDRAEKALAKNKSNKRIRNIKGSEHLSTSMRSIF